MLRPILRTEASHNLSSSPSNSHHSNIIRLRHRHSLSLSHNNTNSNNIHNNNKFPINRLLSSHKVDLVKCFIMEGR